MRPLLPQGFRTFRLLSNLCTDVQAEFFIIFGISIVANAARGHCTELPGYPLKESARGHMLVRGSGVDTAYDADITFRWLHEV